MTTVQYTSRRGTKLYFTLGATLTVVLIVSMLLFPGPWSVFIYTAAASLAGAAVLMFTMGCANIYHRIKMQQIERQQARYFASHHHQNVFYDGQLLLPATLPTSRAVIEAAPETEFPPVDLLNVLPHIETLVIIGAQGAGKTNLLKWIAYRKMQSSMVYALDPHNGEWPADFVCGNGRNFSAISQLLDDLHGRMDKRYKGNEAIEPITIIMDEWRAIDDNCENAAARLKTLLTEGRKVKLNVFMGSHTDRARKLGLEGAADMREGLTLVYLERNIQTGERSARIKIGNDIHPLVVPGEFNLSYEPPELVEYDGEKAICAAPDCRNTVTGKQTYCCNGVTAIRQWQSITWPC